MASYVEKRNRRGHVYYVDPRTGDTRWRLPRGMTAAATRPTKGQGRRSPRGSPPAKATAAAAAAAAATADASANPPLQALAVDGDNRSAPPHYDAYWQEGVGAAGAAGGDAAGVSQGTSNTASAESFTPNLSAHLRAAGWEIYQDPVSGHPYFYQPSTGASSWTAPDTTTATTTTTTTLAAGSAALPSGWEANTDENGNVWYYNTFTEESTWDFPQAGGGPTATVSATSAAAAASSGRRKKNSPRHKRRASPGTAPTHDSDSVSECSSGSSYGSHSSHSSDSEYNDDDDSGSALDSSDDDDDDDTDDDDDAERGRSSRSRRRRRRRRRERRAASGVGESITAVVDTVKDSLWVAQRRASDVMQTAIPAVVELAKSVGSLSATAYTKGSRIVAEAYEAGQRYITGAHTAESARRVFQGSRQFAPLAVDGGAAAAGRRQRGGSGGGGGGGGRRPLPLRFRENGPSNGGLGMMVEVPLSPTGSTNADDVLESGGGGGGDMQREHAQRALSEIGKHLMARGSMSSTTTVFTLLLLMLVAGLPDPAAACIGKIDMVFCIDASGSVDSGEWTQQTDFVKDFVNDFTNTGASLGETGVKIGLMQFAYKNKVAIDLSADLTSILAAAPGRIENGETNTHLCIDAAQAALHSTTAAPADGEAQRGVSRAGASKIIVLVTDGSPSQYSAASNAATAAKNAGTTIIGVGVDTGMCHCPCPCLSGGDKSIRDMVSEPKDDNYVRVDDFDDLTSNLAAITDITCPISCQGTWGPWSACDPNTGRRSRTFLVETAAQDGGDACPPDQEEDCSIDCGYTFSGWSPCENSVGPTSTIGPYTQSRTVIVTVQPLNGGKACPVGETRACTVGVCYSAASAAPTFATVPKIQAIETLPPAHPARSRTDCGGPITDADGLPEPDDGACGNTPPQLFYDLAGTNTNPRSAQNTFAKDATTRFMILRDSTAKHTYFAVQNGSPSGNGPGGLSLNVAFSGAGSYTLTAPVNMAVQDEPSSSGTSGACIASGSNDCYNQYDADTRSGIVRWAWEQGGTSGIVWGPLPLFGYCIKIGKGDSSGVDTFSVEDFIGGAAYTTAIPVPDIVFAYKLDLCVDLCDCEGEACGTAAPGADDLCGGVPCVDDGGGLGEGVGYGGDAGVDDDDNSSDGSSGGGSDTGSDGGNSGDSGNSGGGGGANGQGSSAADGGSAAKSGANGADGDPGAEKDSGDGSGGLGFGAVVGAVAGVLGCCVILIVLVVVQYRRKLKKQAGTSDGELPAGWESYIDEQSGAPVYVNNATGEQQWERPAGVSRGSDHGAAPAIALSELHQNPMRKSHQKTITELPPNWGKDVDAAGNKFYFGPDNQTSWTPPPGSKGGSAVNLVDTSHARTETILPAGWGKDHDSSGAKFYYGPDGSTSWTPPSGSKRGSVAEAAEAAAARGQSSTAAATGAGLPAGWTAEVDQNGDLYYFKAASGEMSWDKPTR